MRLQELKPGMLVQHSDLAFSYEVVFVSRDGALVRGNGGSEYFHQREDGWTEVKTKKLPSARILEIIGQVRSDPEFETRAIDAIITYLDEKERES